MAGDNEPAKLLLPYLQRADELQKHEPLVAYYCRLYAMEKGLRIPQSERTKTTNSLLVSLMNQLEKDKKSLKLGPEDNLHVEGFGLSVFEKADKQDRAGRADLSTAKTFYAASIFFEILNQFGPLQPDLEQKQKYAVWKAADIRKALKEGRKPVPGPPADDDDELSVPSSTSYVLGPSEASANTPGSEFNPSSQFHDQMNVPRSTSFPQSPQFPDGIIRQHSARMPPQTYFDDSSVNQNSTNDVPSPASYPSVAYTGHDFHPPPPASGSDGSLYNQAYHHQSYAQDPPQPPPYGYTPQEASPYSLPNFQSYPSFSESSLPSVPSHYSSYYQGSDSAYAPQSPPPPVAAHPSTAQRASSGINGNIPDHVPAPSQTSHYDINYLPPPEKIAEAHKAAKFAVAALAFDDVSTAVEHLRKSLELLTKPPAGH